MKNILIIVLLVLGIACNTKEEIVDNQSINKSSKTHNHFNTGDIIFQTSLSAQSKAIQLATNSKYSHVGIIVILKNKQFVLEAVQPVKLTKLSKWIKRGEKEHFVVKRLKNTAVLNEKKLSKIIKNGEKYLGKNYDSAFEWSDKKMYCSELVWKLYKETLGVELSKLKELKDFELTNKIVSIKLKERYGEEIPYNEKVVSPSDIYSSKFLKTIYSN